MQKNCRPQRTQGKGRRTQGKGGWMVERKQDALEARFLLSSMFRIISRTHCASRPLLVSTFTRAYSTEARGPNDGIIEMLTRSEHIHDPWIYTIAEFTQTCMRRTKAQPEMNIKSRHSHRRSRSSSSWTTLFVRWKKQRR